MRGLEREYGDLIEFTHVNILLPENKPLLDRFSFNATPELYLVDEQGSIIGFWNDEVDADELRQAFEAALDEEQ